MHSDCLGDVGDRPDQLVVVGQEVVIQTLSVRVPSPAQEAKFTMGAVTQPFWCWCNT